MKIFNFLLVIGLITGISIQAAQPQKFVGDRKNEQALKDLFAMENKKPGGIEYLFLNGTKHESVTVAYVIDQEGQRERKIEKQVTLKPKEYITLSGKKITDIEKRYKYSVTTLEKTTGEKKTHYYVPKIFIYFYMEGAETQIFSLPLRRSIYVVHRPWPYLKMKIYSYDK